MYVAFFQLLFMLPRFVLLLLLDVFVVVITFVADTVKEWKTQAIL